MNAVVAVSVVVALIVGGCGGATSPDSAQDVDVRVERVDGDAPFSVEAESIEAGDRGLWGRHQLHVTSRSDAPLAVATDDITIDLTGEVAAEGKLAPDEFSTLAPGESRTIMVLLPAEDTNLPSGERDAEVLVPFWRNIDAIEPERPNGVARVGLTYDIP